MKTIQLTGWSALACAPILLALSSMPTGASTQAQRQPVQAQPEVGMRADFQVLTHVYHEIRPLDLDTYTRVAGEIRLVRVLGHEFAWDSDDGLPYTRLHVEVLSTLKGEPASVLELHVPGADIPEHRVVAETAPRLPDGETALLFLTVPADGSFRGVLGLCQGTYRVAPDALGQPRVSGLHTRGLEELDTFVARVSALVEAQTLERK